MKNTEFSDRLYKAIRNEFTEEELKEEVTFEIDRDGKDHKIPVQSWLIGGSEYIKESYPIDEKRNFGMVVGEFTNIIESILTYVGVIDSYITEYEEHKYLTDTEE